MRLFVVFFFCLLLWPREPSMNLRKEAGYGSVRHGPFEEVR